MSDYAERTGETLHPYPRHSDYEPSVLNCKQWHFGIGFAWNHPDEFSYRGKKAWVSVQVPDLFGHVWVWKRVF